MRLIRRVDQNKVQGLVVIAGVHDDSAIITKPHAEAINPVDERFRYRVVQRDLASEKEAEGCFPGTKQPGFLPAERFPSFGLNPIVSSLSLRRLTWYDLSYVRKYHQLL